jgi:hypothetical protein
MARGRPPKAPEEKKVQISVRLPPDLLERLERARGRTTLSEEITNRLLQSFEKKEQFDIYFNRLFSRLLVYALQFLTRDTGHPWYRNRFTFEHAITAAGELFSYFQPSGLSSVPADLPLAEAQRARGLDPAPVIEQAETYPYGKLAARWAVFHMELQTEQASDVASDDFEEIKRLNRERQLLKDLGDELRGFVTSKGQAQRDLMNWSDK